ncbi:hypothetical protein V9T40_008258 [Parthenolecanium corni]|uniref:Uncharacterized protein n=1 Tax=Parthenolecanium corni TaxID=536013 RepID=A0AAN9TLC3_9HEMI
MKERKIARRYAYVCLKTIVPTQSNTGGVDFFWKIRRHDTMRTDVTCRLTMARPITSYAHDDDDMVLVRFTVSARVRCRIASIRCEMVGHQNVPA